MKQKSHQKKREMSASLSAKSKPQIKDAPPHQVDLIRVTGRRKEIFFSFGDFFFFYLFRSWNAPLLV